MFNNGAEQGTIDRKQTFMSAFGKVSYDPTQPAAHQLLDAGDAHHVDRLHAGVQRHRRRTS